MVYCEQDMYEYVYRNLRGRYPRSEGWEIRAQDDWGAYRPDFVVERCSWDGTIERVICEVKAENRVTQRHISQINDYARRLAGRNVRIRQKILAIPYGVPYDHVPDDIDVMVLRNFGYESDDY